MHYLALVRFLFVVLAFSLPGVWMIDQAAAADLEQVEALVKGGAPHLALRLVERDQPPETQQEQWMRWERQRFEIYQALRNRDAIAQRAARLPPGLPPAFRHWAQTQAVKAHLDAGDATGARKLLRRLIWYGNVAGGDKQVSAAQLARWRRLVIRSYLMEDNLADAQTALLRYKQDYRAKSDAWQVLHAEVLLRAGRTKAAFDVLAGVQSYEAHLMRRLAGLRLKWYQPRDVLKQAVKFGGALRTQPVLRRQAWVLAAEAAAQAGDQAMRVGALEKALTEADTPGQGRLFQVGADDLWRAYDELAEAVGNAARLVIGNDSDWLAKAASYPSTQGEYVRALYAFLSRQGQNEKTRVYAHQRLTELLFEAGRGRVVQVLYTESGRYQSIDAVPAPVRYRLADKAFAVFDIHLAARLIKDLAASPYGVDADTWALRRARILIYADDYKPALILLSGLLDDKPRLEAEFAQRYLQALFDLQTVGRHAEALALLESVYERADNARMQREILYWQADSQLALGRHQEAAELYLRSATFNGSKGEDPWGHSARFHAAEALGKAGLTADARRVYLKLLKSTTDPGRRTLIEHNIQQLWLSGRDTTRP